MSNTAIDSEDRGMVRRPLRRRGSRLLLSLLLCLVVAIFFKGTVGIAVGDADLEEARILKEGGVLQDASRSYMRYLERFPEDSEARWELAQIFYELEQPVDAAHQLVWLLQRHPDHAAVRVMLNDCIQRIGERANEAENVDLLLQLARFRRSSGSQAEAEADYRRYLSVKPEDAVARHELAQMIKDQGGRDAEALLQLERSIQYAQDPMEMRYKRALWLYYDSERQAQALIAFEILTGDYPNLADAHAHLGDLYRYSGKLYEARDSYRRAYELDKTNERAIKGYSEVLIQTRSLARAREASNEGDYARASDLYAAHFREMVSVRNAYEELYRHALYQELDETSEREFQFYQEYLVRTPEERILRREYVDSLLQQGRYAEATREMDWLIQRDPENISLRLERSRYMTYSESTLAEAEAELQRIVEIDGESAEAYARLGDVLRYKGDLEGANRAYRRAAFIDPNYKPANDGILVIRNTFPPEVSVSAAYIHDYSVDYNHFWLEGRYRHFFNVGKTRADLAYRYLYYAQKRRHILPRFHHISKDVEGHQLIGSLQGPLSGRWGYLGELSIAFYDQVDSTWQGKLMANYTHDDFWLQFGVRKQEAVTEYYNINALLADVQIYDLLVETRYLFKSDDWYARWGIHAALDVGYLSDGNTRGRLLAKLTNHAIEKGNFLVQYGIGARIQAHEKRSPYYFSPGFYTGVGPVVGLDHRVSARTNWGVSGAAYYMMEDNEWDFALGGYFNNRISSSVGLGLRLDYGQTTYSRQRIQTFSGVISLMVDL